MKQLFVIVFAVSSLLRPSLVLCMEATGDVRVEFQESVCCDSEHATADVVFSAKPAGDCDGCRDVTLSTHSLTFKRLAEPAMSTAIVYVFPFAVEASRAIAPLPRALGDMRQSSHSLFLSSTIIRR